MYLPKHFEQHDPLALQTLMRERSLATVVSVVDGDITANHIPLVFDASAGEHGILRGHVARANPLWLAAQGSAVLAIFQGAQAYISPSWYPSKATTHKVVPTWNYAVVHAHGQFRAVDQAPWVLDFVSGLTQQHEARLPTPWAVRDAPEDYVAQMLKAIVGIEIVLNRALVGKWKVSQNHTPENRQGAASGLLSRGRDDTSAMAALMGERLDK